MAAILPGEKNKDIDNKSKVSSYSLWFESQEFDLPSSFYCFLFGFTWVCHFLFWSFLYSDAIDSLFFFF